MNRLYELLRHVTSRSLDLKAFTGQLADVAFEITTAESFLAGIASALLERGVMDPSHRVVLEKEFLRGTTWNLGDGARVDLSSAPELLQAARAVQELRDECLRSAAS